MTDITSLRIKEEIELYKIECQFNRFVRYYHLLCFGNGKYYWLPLLWLIVCTVGYVFALSQSLNVYYIIYNIALAIEGAVNAYFGYRYCQEYKLTKMIYYYHKRYSLDSTKVIQTMNLIVMTVFFAILLITVLSCLFYTSQIDSIDSNIGAIFALYFIVISSNFVVIGNSMYLCGLWCIQMYILNSSFDSYFLQNLLRIQVYGRKKGSEEFIEITKPAVNTMRDLEDGEERNMFTTTSPFFNEEEEEEVIDTSNSTQPSSDIRQSELQELEIKLKYDQQYIERKLLFYLQETRYLADYWEQNHLLRILTGVVIIAYSSVEWYRAVVDGDILYAMVNSVIVFLYYGIIWLTAVSAGSVNDRMFGETINKLARLYSELKISDNSVDRQIGQTIHKLTALQGSDGLHFSGVVMSMEKAVSVGSIIGSVMAFCINYFCSAQI